MNIKPIVDVKCLKSVISSNSIFPRRNIRGENIYIDQNMRCRIGVYLNFFVMVEKFFFVSNFALKIFAKVKIILRSV